MTKLSAGFLIGLGVIGAIVAVGLISKVLRLCRGCRCGPGPG
jgi:hypothetical protein